MNQNMDNEFFINPPRTKTVILISGKKRSGKDFVSMTIREHLDCQIISFAQPLKEIVASTLGISVEQLDTLKNEGAYLYEGNDKFEISFRKILQNFGSDAVKPVFGNNVWAEIARKKIRQIPLDYIIVSDLRFLSEIEALEQDGNFNIVTVRILGGEALDSHCSETELDNYSFDYYIDNINKDLSICNKVKVFVENITKGKL